MELQPRHQKLIDYLSQHAPNKFGLDELAKILNLSMRAMRNEAPKLVELGYIRRKAVGRSYDYYVDKVPSKYLIAGKPCEPYTREGIVETLLHSITLVDYIPVLTKLDWTMPYVVSHLTARDQSKQESCRKALERFLQAVDATALTCRRLLSTPQLWDDRLEQWFTVGLSEKNLEALDEVSRLAIQMHGRLESSEKNPDNNLRNPIDYH